MKNSTSNHVKTGEKVKIITGKYKGLVGTIQKIEKKDQTITLDSVPPIIKQLKKSKSSNDSQKKEIPRKIHVSNVVFIE